jgi:hypothetical protein
MRRGVRSASGIGGLAAEATRRTAVAEGGGPTPVTTCRSATGGSSTGFVIGTDAASDEPSWRQRVEASKRLNVQHGIAGSLDRPAIDVSACGVACECPPWTSWAGPAAPAE